jgi:hypothetical protein
MWPPVLFENPPCQASEPSIFRICSRDRNSTGAPAFDSSIKGRLGRFVWRLVGPALEQQQRFNGAVADHLNRNVAAHLEAAESLTALIGTVRNELQALVRFESLLQHLQTITVTPTADRSLGGAEIRQRPRSPSAHCAQARRREDRCPTSGCWWPFDEPERGRCPLPRRSAV